MSMQMRLEGAARGEQPSSGSRRKAGRGPMLVGLVLSALAHVALVVLYPFLAGPRSDRAGVLVRPAVREVGGMRALQIVEVPAEDVGDPSDPVVIDDPGPPEATPEMPDFEEEWDVFVPGRYRSAGERLRVGEGDPRLWQPISSELLAPTPEEIVRLRLAAAIEAANDSAFAEAERLAQSLDWTHTDEDGKRWGVSPGRIHLGDVEIPLPFGFGPPPDYNGDQADWAFRMADIDRAAGTLAARMSWRERAEAMRLRREARRAREEAEKENAASVVRPDTTSSAPRRR